MFFFFFSFLARPTQPLEPILIPKLRIRLADFPYLHCSNMPEAVHLGDLLQIMGTVRREIYTLSPGFSRASESSPDAAGTATLSKAQAPLSGRTHSRAPCPSQRKENSPRGSCRLLRDRLRYRTHKMFLTIVLFQWRYIQDSHTALTWSIF